MENLREWVLKVAGVIILISAADMIMLESEMKKYIKPILGIILVITIVSPIFKNMAKETSVFEEYSMAYSNKLIEKAKDKQLEDISYLYEKKLSEEARKLILEQYGIKSKVLVTTTKKIDDFGDIEGIEIALENETDLKISKDELKEYIERTLGVSKSKIKVLALLK